MITSQLELTYSLDKASKLYYQGFDTEYTDIEFDKELKRLAEMEKKSGIVYPNSPTQRVGSDIQDGFKKYAHPKPMLTIDNTYNDNELVEWYDRIVAKYGEQKINASVKYDGISCELHYKGGMFYKAVTRGDKNEGDDITENVKTIKSVPLSISYDNINDNDMFYVRGEILLPKSKLIEINIERVSNNENAFANTRNACSGSVKQLDPKVTAKRGLIFRAWDCFGDNKTFSTMEEKMTFLSHIGFYYEDGTLLPSFDFNIDTINSFHSLLNENICPDFDYDGIVLKIDNIEIQDEIGTKDTRSIEWGIARKWNEEYECVTELLNVEWQVGRTGVLTPVGILDTVECAGVKISNVTLHNADFIEKFDLHKGNDVVITRSGGVIPYVIGVKHDLLMETNGAYPKVEIPTVCPDCGHPVVRDGALLKCVNEKCPSIAKGKILQFCSKDCMNIMSIGESVVEDIYNTGLVTNICDLYYLAIKDTKDIVSKLGNGYGVKKVNKILSEIEKSKAQPFEKVLYGLGIPGVGKVTARVLANKFKDIHVMFKATEDDYKSVDGIGDIMAKDIVDWFSNYDNVFDVIFNLEGMGLKMKIDEESIDKETTSILTGLNVVFSGSSNRFKGDEVEAFLEQNGAKCGHSISKKTNYLIIGDKPGASKVSKANELGIEIINENDFYTKFNL